MKSGVLTAAIALVSLVAPEIGLAEPTDHRVWIRKEERSLQGILQHEVDEMTASYHPKRVIMLLLNPKTSLLEAAAASKGGKLQSHSGTLQEAKRFRFDPGALVDSFTSSELAQCGIRNPVSTTAFDIIHLFSAVAEGGTLKPENRMIFPKDRIKVLQESLIGQIHGKDAPIRLARVDGIRVAGAAGHGGKNPIAACFAGYFPANHPRYVCVVVIEGADVVMKYQRGALLSAPHFSFAARKVQRLGVTQ
jgi:hypothetical protein